MLRPLILSLAFAAGTAYGAGWETWKDCRLVTSQYFDGDSFHVVKSGRDRIFRLYAVDTAETSDEFPDRVKEQQKYFGATKEEVIAGGKKAEELTRRLLKEPFTVETQWIDAKGNSYKERFFGKITLSDGSDLAMRLVEAGLARSYGIREGLPLSYLGKLDQAQAAARRSRLGLWGGKIVPMPKDPDEDEPAPTPTPDEDVIDTTSMFNQLRRESSAGLR